MGEKKKKEKKQRQMVILREKSVETPKKIKNLIEGLEELKREQKHVDIQICQRCKSHRIHRVGSMIGDMSGHMGLLPPKFECLDCGWRERMVIKATSRKMGIKEVAIIAEALESNPHSHARTNLICPKF